MAGDLEKPVSTDAYATILQVIRDNFADLITSLEFGDPANLPTGAKRINPTSKVIERWSGAAWVEWASYLLTSSASASATADAIARRDSSGDLAGDITGNAPTATALETARTIGGVSFNGTANINLPGVNATGNQNTSGSATKHGVLNVKVIDIGAWDMDAAGTHFVSHGVDYTKIREPIQVFIVDDVGTTRRDLCVTESGVSGSVRVATTQLVLTRVVSGIYDSSTAFKTSFGGNRGWITVRYVD
jgi:hypothetical protein